MPSCPDRATEPFLAHPLASIPRRPAYGTRSASEDFVKLAQILSSKFDSCPRTILVAEPDPMLRRGECRVLSPKYQIVQTSSAEEAVRIAARHETELDLLLTEVRL